MAGGDGGCPEGRAGRRAGGLQLGWGAGGRGKVGLHLAAGAGLGEVEARSLGLRPPALPAPGAACRGRCGEEAAAGKGFGPRGPGACGAGRPERDCFWGTHRASGRSAGHLPGAPVSGECRHPKPRHPISASNRPGPEQPPAPTTPVPAPGGGGRGALVQIPSPSWASSPRRFGESLPAVSTDLVAHTGVRLAWQRRWDTVTPGPLFACGPDRQGLRSWQSPSHPNPPTSSSSALTPGAEPQAPHPWRPRLPPPVFPALSSFLLPRLFHLQPCGPWAGIASA